MFLIHLWVLQSGTNVVCALPDGPCKQEDWYLTCKFIKALPGFTSCCEKFYKEGQRDLNRTRLEETGRETCGKLVRDESKDTSEGSNQVWT